MKRPVGGISRHSSFLIHNSSLNFPRLDFVLVRLGVALQLRDAVLDTFDEQLCRIRDIEKPLLKDYGDGESKMIEVEKG